MKTYEIGFKKTKVFYLHGLRGHGLAQEGALLHVSRQAGMEILSLEMPGHGVESSKRHCLVPPYQEIIDSICAQIRQHSLQSEQVVLMGYSFGAALMILAAQTLKDDKAFAPKVAGFIGISTAFDVSHNVPKWQLILSGGVAKMSRFFFERAWRVSRWLTISEMSITLISPEKTVQDSIRNDALIYKGRIPLATSAQVHYAGVAAKKCLKKSTIDTLLLHSKDDAIAIAPNKGDFAKHVKLRLFSSLRHNCIDGVSREVAQSRKMITQFLIERR